MTRYYSHLQRSDPKAADAVANAMRLVGADASVQEEA